MPSRVASLVLHASQNSWANWPLMASFYVGLSSQLAAALAFKKRGCTHSQISSLFVPAYPQSFAARWINFARGLASRSSMVGGSPMAFRAMSPTSCRSALRWRAFNFLRDCRFAKGGTDLGPNVQANCLRSASLGAKFANASASLPFPRRSRPSDSLSQLPRRLRRPFSSLLHRDLSRCGGGRVRLLRR